MGNFFPYWMVQGEKYLVKIIVFLITISFITQVFLFSDITRDYISKVEQIEGIPLNSDENQKKLR